MKIPPPLLPGFELATFQSRVKHSTNTIRQSFQLAEPLWTDPGLKSGISMRELISTLKEKDKKRGVGMNGQTFSKKKLAYDRGKSPVQQQKWNQNDSCGYETGSSEIIKFDGNNDYVDETQTGWLADPTDTLFQASTLTRHCDRHVSLHPQINGSVNS